jgi:hypothetical protein
MFSGVCGVEDGDIGEDPRQVDVLLGEGFDQVVKLPPVIGDQNPQIRSFDMGRRNPGRVRLLDLAHFDALTGLGT